MADFTIKSVNGRYDNRGEGADRLHNSSYRNIRLPRVGDTFSDSGRGKAMVVEVEHTSQGFTYVHVQDLPTYHAPYFVFDGDSDGKPVV